MSVTIKGLDEANRAFAKLLSGVRRATPEGLSDAGAHLVAETIPRTPVDTGDLRASGNHRLEDGGRSAVVQFGAGLDYAVRVHEDLGFRARMPGTGPKFLEITYRVETPVLIDLIARRWKGAVDDAT